MPLIYNEELTHNYTEKNYIDSKDHLSRRLWYRHTVMVVTTLKLTKVQQEALRTIELYRTYQQLFGADESLYVKLAI